MAIMKRDIGVLALCLFAATQAVAADQPAPRNDAGTLDGQALVYGYDEMFEFDTAAWFARKAPHLRNQAESISHWAGYSGISPKVLIALMEQQSGVVSRRNSRVDGMRQPFGRLSKQVGFNAQTRDVAQALRQALYEREDATSALARGPVALAKANPLKLLHVRSGDSLPSAALKGDFEFQQVYSRLFNGPRRAVDGRTRAATAAARDVSIYASSFLQFPFPIGQRWHVGGAHTNTGSGNYPMSSLDMSLGGGWGSNQSNTWVVASAPGTFKRHSSCFAEVVHSNGLSTTYYHMMNLRYATGATVNRGASIGNPANTQAQALCNGGQSTGPHVHWSLKSNGSFYHLNGVTLSDYVITATGSSYDTNCSRFYLTRNGSRYCSGWFYSH